MLVLARRVGETIVIDEDVHITVVQVKGDTVRLGIAAPEYVRVDRQEVHERRAEFADKRRSICDVVGPLVGTLRGVQHEN